MTLKTNEFQKNVTTPDTAQYNIKGMTANSGNL